MLFDLLGVYVKVGCVMLLSSSPIWNSLSSRDRLGGTRASMARHGPETGHMATTCHLSAYIRQHWLSMNNNHLQTLTSPIHHHQPSSFLSDYTILRSTIPMLNFHRIQFELKGLEPLSGLLASIVLVHTCRFTRWFFIWYDRWCGWIHGR